MKTHRFFFLLLLLWTSMQAQQPVAVQKQLGTNALTGDIQALTGRTIGIGSGGTLYFDTAGAFAGDSSAFRAAVGAGTSSFNGSFSALSGKPTTLAGYGITDPIVLTSGSYSNPAWITALAWSKLSGTPTTLSGYGITDPIVLTSGSYSNPSWITALANTKLTGAYTSSGETVSTPSRVLGRVTSGAGAAEEMTASTVLDFIGSTRGSILYRGASGWSALTPGTNGYVLTTAGGGADPSWTAASGGSAVWGAITGTLSNQTDLQAALNAKQNNLTTGNLSEASSAVLTFSGGTGAVIGTGTTIQVKQATTSQSGYLSSTDWNTFNGKQASGSYLTALTGDGTASGPGSATFTLANVNGNVGTWGSATQVPQFTVNIKGLITAAANVTITPAVGSITGLAANMATWLGTSSSANLAATVTDETGTGALVFANTPTLVTPVIGAATGTSLSVTGQLTSTISTGTAPLVVSSTTQVSNLNVSQLIGGTWAAPGAMGGTTPNTAIFTSVTITPSAGTVGSTNAPTVGQQLWFSPMTSDTPITLPTMVDGNSFTLFALQADGTHKFTTSGNVYRWGDPNTAVTNITPNPAGNHVITFKRVNGIVFYADTFTNNSVSYGATGGTTFTAHGVMLGEGTSALVATAAGTSGAPFLSGGASADGAYGALNLAGGSSLVTGLLPLANGGTNANLTASNGGIFYSTASAGAILAGTATANQVLLSGSSTTPAWSTATYPATTTINQLLYSSANNVIAGLATANNGVLTTGTTGIPVITALGTDGQVIIGSSAGAPTAATLTAGSNITITNGHNSITIASSGGGAGGNNSALFTATANGANNAVASDTSIIGTGVGSLTTAANYFAAGTSLCIELGGYITTAASPATLDVKIKAGSTVVGDTGAVTPTANLTSQAMRLYALITCRTAGASGTFIVNTIMETTGATLTAPESFKIVNTSNVTLDTTGTLAWNVTAAWGATTAGDTITGTNFTMFTPGTGIADPGGNGILNRTALNTVSALTAPTGTTPAVAGIARETFSNANKTITAGTTLEAQTGTMSAARTATLPAANTLNAGDGLWIVDESGTVTGANTLIIARAGSDTINGAATSITLVSAYAYAFLKSDGSSKWTVTAYKDVSDAQTLTDGATVTWPIDSLAHEQSAIVTLGGNRTLAWSATPTKGQTGTFKVIQDGTGSRTLALPANSKVINGGSGAVTLSTAINSVDFLTWWSDGTNTYWNIGKNYN